MRLDRVIAVRNDKTIFRDGEQCVKVFNRRYSKADVLNEAANQARMEVCGISVPKIYSVNKVEEKWAIVSEYIKGKTLEQMILEEPDRKEEYLEYLAELQIKVHEKICAQFIDLKDVLTYRISNGQMDDAVCRRMQLRLDEMPSQRNICHGDFNPSNVVVAEDGTAYILDWSKAAKGDTAADAAASYLYFCCKNDMETANKYIELYCLKSGTSESEIRKWVPMIAASEFMYRNQKEKRILLSMIEESQGGV